MSFFKKTLGFMTVLGALPAALAATMPYSGRPSIVTNRVTNGRLPSMVSYSNYVSGTTGGTTSSLLADSECIDAYTACIKAGDVCGPNFEECTNRVLFHAKMPQCLSTLAQCTANGITSLFGVGNTTALSAIRTTNSYGEVTDYTYPTDGSVLGQLITAGAISNRYDTATCVKRYTSCLNKDNVCGNSFELCTTNTEFRKQRVYCESTLARCQSEGLIELFGSTTTSGAPAATSRVGELITEGAALAATEAVSTCYKVVDQCILNACSVNPFRCYDAATVAQIELGDGVATGQVKAEDSNINIADANTTAARGAISGFIKNSCLSTIGANKYCYATFLGNGVMPTASQLNDEDNQEEIFDEAYSARMNSALKTKILDLVDDFDARAKKKCSETISSCAMRVCGKGVGAACYKLVNTDDSRSINGETTRDEIRNGCSAIVNTDANCQYAAVSLSDNRDYSAAYINNTVFDTLFPEYSERLTNDPIGVVASLNASLANSFSDAALAQLRKQCQAVATGCVKSTCGTDYVECYRNRTDVMSNLTNTGDAAFDASMNKVGGVLDYTTILGLCLNTVKNSSACEEHLAIEKAKIDLKQDNATNMWGESTSTRDGWIDAGGAKKMTMIDGVQKEDGNGNKICSNNIGDEGICYDSDASGNVFDEPVMVTYDTYASSQAARTLFRDLLVDIEYEAQAKYLAKLTKEQNQCFQLNSGGIMGNNSLGSAFVWAKLRSNRVPKTYATSGLQENQFVASNDLYGSFCLARITVTSDDRRVQELLAKGPKWATAYFATGDMFTCGSWIPRSELEKIAKEIGSDARDEATKHDKRERTWYTILGGVATMVAGGFATDSMQNHGLLGGILGRDLENKDGETLSKSCEKAMDEVVNASRTSNIMTKLTSAINKAGKISGVDTSDLSRAKNIWEEKYNNWENAAKDEPGCKAQASDDNEGDLGKIEDAGDIAYETGVSGKTCAKSVAKAELEQAKALVNRRANNVKAECSNSGNDEKDTEAQKKANKKRAWTNITGGAVSGAIGSVLTWHVVKDLQDASADRAEQAAIDAWMNEIGNHIQCVIGADYETFVFGETVGLAMNP